MTTWFAGHRRLVLGVLASSAVLAAAAGCGSSSSSSSTAAAGTSASSSGSTSSSGSNAGAIKIGIATPLGSPIANYPGVFAGAQAAVNAIDKAGGVGGHQIVLDTCNTKGDPHQEVACGQKFASDHVVATVGELMFADVQGYLQVLNNAGIADIGATALDVANYNMPNSFPIDYYSGLYAPCGTPTMANLSASSNHRIAGAISEIPTSQNNEHVIQSSAKNTGADYVGSVPAPTTTADYSPIVQQLKNLNPGIVSIATPGPGVIGIITSAASAGLKWTWCIPDGWTNGSSPLIKLGSTVSNFYTPATLPPLSATAQYPELKTFIANMAAAAAAGVTGASTKPADYAQDTLRAWLAVHAFVDIAQTISGPITAQSVMNATKTAKLNLGLVPPINFATPVGKGNYPRVFNDYIRLMQWQSGKADFYLVPNTGWNVVDMIFGK